MMITLKEVRKSFKQNGEQIPILHIEQWQVKRGEHIAFLGPSGSGKSTLLHLLSGVMQPDSGEIWIEDQPIHRLSESQRDQYRAKSVGYIFQEFHLISSLTLKQNVELIMQPAMSNKEAAEVSAQWFERVGLTAQQHRLPSQVSRGQQQRAAMIRALIRKPSLVLADEPTGSLDYETAAAMMSLLLQICEEEGLTLLTVTHDVHLAASYPRQVHIEDLNAIRRGVTA
ncbi:ABC transporter ATP-binding protein [Paenibacillus ferrarius]|uniref:ABC transporter ATP-binding protein n=1 Tax=Paenibacillus ferrarius TaxID=1469647 RepID=UPI003D2A18FA